MTNPDAARLAPAGRAASRTRKDTPMNAEPELTADQLGHAEREAWQTAANRGMRVTPADVRAILRAATAAGTAAILDAVSAYPPELIADPTGKLARNARYGQADPIMWPVVKAADLWLDDLAGLDYQEQPLAQDWARVAKITEELGEAIAALIGYTAQNPRKGFTHSKADMLGELADVVLTGILAIQHFTKDTALTRAVIAASFAKLASRVPDEYDRPESMPLIPAHVPAAHCPRCARSGVGACDDFPDCPAGRAADPDFVPGFGPVPGSGLGLDTGPAKRDTWT